MKTIKLIILIALMMISCTNKEALSPRFNHVMLRVSDLDTSVKFYSDAFELKVTNDQLRKIEVLNSDGSTMTRDVNMAFLKFPGQDFVFELSEAPALDSIPVLPFYQHLGIDVIDIESAFKRVKEAGAEVIVPIRVVKASGIEAKQAFFKGPDGELFELMEIISGEF